MLYTSLVTLPLCQICGDQQHSGRAPSELEHWTLCNRIFKVLFFARWGTLTVFAFSQEQEPCGKDLCAGCPEVFFWTRLRNGARHFRWDTFPSSKTLSPARYLPMILDRTKKIIFVMWHACRVALETLPWKSLQGTLTGSRRTISRFMHFHPSRLRLNIPILNSTSAQTRFRSEREQQQTRFCLIMKVSWPKTSQTDFATLKCLAKLFVQTFFFLPLVLQLVCTWN